VALTEKGLNFHEFKFEEVHEKNAVAIRNLGIISAFAWRQGKTKKTCVEAAGRRNFRIHINF
jgi:hypothetical protein